MHTACCVYAVLFIVHLSCLFVCLSVCPSVCIFFYIMDFFFKPISTKLSKKHHCVMAIQICKMRQLTSSSKGYSLQLKKMETRSYEEKSNSRKRYKIFLFNTIGLRLRLISFPYR